jgi:hypothetical protein
MGGGSGVECTSSLGGVTTMLGMSNQCRDGMKAGIMQGEKPDLRAKGV